MITVHSLLYYVQPWILPPGLNIMLIVLGIIISFFWQRIGKLFIIGGILFLWALCTPIVAYHLIDLLQNQYPLLDPLVLKQESLPDAIVVLGGGDALEAEYRNKHTVSDDTWHRLHYAAYLHEKTHLPIIVSGGKYPGSTESEADLMATTLRDNYHINAAFKEDKSFTTADESKFLLPTLKQHGFNHIFLVTNAWHMPRSVFIFQHTGIKVTPAPMGYFIYGPGYSLISFLPNINSLHASSIAIHEFIGTAWYHLLT